jgi:hypothetical protein
MTLLNSQSLYITYFRAQQISGSQVAIASRNFVMLPSIFKSNYVQFMFVFVLLKTWFKNDCTTELLISGSEWSGHQNLCFMSFLIICILVNGW